MKEGLLGVVVVLTLIILCGCGHESEPPQTPAPGASTPVPTEPSEIVRADNGTCSLEHQLPTGLLRVRYDAYAPKTWCRWTFQPEGTGDEVLLGEWLGPMTELDHLLASPDGRYLAVVSRGEGHPVLEVMDLPTLLDEHREKALCTVDPYPGWIAIERWEEGRLIVVSGMLLTHRSGEYDRVPAVLEFEELERFSMDPKTGKCIALSGDARDPAKYFLRQLRSPDAGIRDTAAMALAALNDPAALPALRAAAAVEKDPDVKTDIETAIRKLSGEGAGG